MGWRAGEFEVESYLSIRVAALCSRFDEDSIHRSSPRPLITLTWDDLLRQILIDCIQVFSGQDASSSFHFRLALSYFHVLDYGKGSSSPKKNVSFVELDFPYGHESFLVSAGIPPLTRII